MERFENGQRVRVGPDENDPLSGRTGTIPSGEIDALSNVLNRASRAVEL